MQGEALAWLAENPAPAGASVVTSLPDVSEVAELGYEGWRRWFVEAAAAVIRWVPEDGVAIFYQSDVRHRGAWVDKGYLVLRAAELVDAPIVWHKIVCRHPPGTRTLGRPSYAHMICLSRVPRPPGRVPMADVLPATGAMTWSRAMGLDACRFACDWLREETATKVVVDPFCGLGTVLAVAEQHGFDALGVELSAKRVRKARALVV